LDSPRTIRKWSLSGQGEGAVIVMEDPAYGNTKLMKESGNDNRSNFVADKEAYLLYLWEKSEYLEILSSFIHCMNETIGCTSAKKTQNISTYGKNKKRAITPTNDAPVDSMVKGIKIVSYQEQITAMKKDAEELEDKIIIGTSTDVNVIDIWKRRLAAKKADIQQFENKVQELEAVEE
jgi:hypothetical protein